MERVVKLELLGIAIAQSGSNRHELFCGVISTQVTDKSA